MYNSNFEQTLFLDSVDNSLLANLIVNKCKSRNNSHIIVDCTRQMQLPPGGNMQKPGDYAELRTNILHTKTINAVHGNKVSLLLSSFKPQINDSELPDIDKTPLQVLLDECFFDEVIIWPTYNFCWKGLDILKSIKRHKLIGKQTRKNLTEAFYVEGGNPDKFYEKCFIEVVNCDKHLYSFSEQILRPILHQKPFIIVGSQYINLSLKKLGFQLYNEIIDYHFDTIRDSDERISAFQDEFLRIIDTDSANYQSLVLKVENKIMYNFVHAIRLLCYDPQVPDIVKDMGPFIDQIQKNENMNRWSNYLLDGNQESISFVQSVPELHSMLLKHK